MNKNTTNKKDFYTPILNLLKTTTNLTDISKQLNLSKQNLNYYLCNLKKKGYVTKKDKGWYELTEKSKNSTKYDEFLPKDFIRAHAYIWIIKFPKEIEDWSKRIEILKAKGINYKLVGVLKDIPRIKVLNRKIWLCKNHIRIFDNKNASYYGKNPIEARHNALNELFLIVSALERKLGVFLKPFELEWVKQHYALIKNDLAIDQNRKGVIWRISDELGEWLLIDDSLEQGGELENVGKQSFKVNIKMQKWWNENKETDFEVTPKLILKGFEALTNNQSKQAEEISKFAIALNKHIPAYEGMAKYTKQLSNEIRLLRKTFQHKNIKSTDLNQKSLNEY